MAGSPRDEERERWIEDEIIVDAYEPEEQALGWYYYLENKVQFPFLAKCIAEREISPRGVGDEVEVMGLASEDECEREMFVLMRWERSGFAVPLSQLKPIAAEEETAEAIAEWHCWVGQGYEL
jgi:hypothetical protein